MLQCEPSSANFHNIHTSIQLIFGELEISKVAGEISAVIKEDPKGWQGESPLIVTFYLSSWILMAAAPTATQIGLHIRTTPQSISLMSKLGMRLTIYTTSLSDTEHVQVLRHCPNTPAKTRPIQTYIPYQTASSRDCRSRYWESYHETRPVWRESHDLNNSRQYSRCRRCESLADKAEVTAKPLADCTILTSYGQHKRYFIFPFPVRGADYKLRVARKSSYLEVCSSSKLKQ